MVPLCRQMDFFVPELTEQVKTDGKDEDSDEDRGTDITGKPSHIFRHCQLLYKGERDKTKYHFLCLPARNFQNWWVVLKLS